MNPHVGLLFIDFETGTRLRFNGVASVDDDDPLVEFIPGRAARGPGPGRSVFANCRRYVHEYQKVDAVAVRAARRRRAPVPDWKLDPWFDGTLPADDPAHDPARPSAPAIPRF